MAREKFVSVGARRLKDLVARKVVTQSEIGERINAHQSEVSYWLAGANGRLDKQRVPGVDVLARIEREFGIPASSWAERAVDPPLPATGTGG